MDRRSLAAQLQPFHCIARQGECDATIEEQAGVRLPYAIALIFEQIHRWADYIQRVFDIQQRHIRGWAADVHGQLTIAPGPNGIARMRAAEDIAAECRRVAIRGDRYCRQRATLRVVVRWQRETPIVGAIGDHRTCEEMAL